MTDLETGPDDVVDREGLARALRQARVAAGLSVRDLSLLIGAKPGTLSGYFSGRHLPTVSARDMYKAMLGACGVTDFEPWLEALDRARSASDGRVTRPDCPYPGLIAFQEGDAARFYGREETTRLLIRALWRITEDPETPPVVALIGASGSGKSSLLRAGVIPAVIFSAPRPWEIQTKVITPGPRPAERFRAVLEEAPNVLIIDQFEEIFTAGADEQERDDAIKILMGVNRKRTVVAIGMRADFYGQATRLPGLVPVLQHLQIVVSPLTADGLREAIVLPARNVGVTVEPALVEMIVRDMAPRGASSYAHDPGSLPLFAHAMLSSWKQSRSTLLTVADYERSGGIRRAIEQTGEDAYGRLTPAQQVSARQLFRRLVHVGDDTIPTRRRMRHAEMLEMHDPAALREVADLFVAQRLLTSDTDAIELAHEALLTGWDRLRGWVDDDRAELRVQRQIAAAAAQWELHSDDELVLRGGRLEAALDWMADEQHAQALTRTEAEFVRLSERRAEESRELERRRSRRWQQLLAFAVVLAVVAVGLAVYGLKARNDADRERSAARLARDQALSRQLALEVDDLRPQQPSLAAQLALAAYRISPTPEARSALVDTSGFPIVTRLLGPYGPTEQMTVSPDGRTLALAAADGRVHLWDISAARPRALGSLGEQRLTEPLNAVSFSADGRLLAAAGTSGEIQVWDVRNPSAPRVVPLPEATTLPVIYSLAFSARDALLAAAAADGTVRLWSLADPAHPRTLPALEVPGGGTRDARSSTGNFLRAVSFSADGNLVAGAALNGDLILWRPATPAPLTVVATTATAGLFAVAVSPDSKTVAAGGRDGIVRSWDISDPARPVARPSLPGFTNRVDAVTFSADGTELAAASRDGTAIIWNWVTHRVLRRLSNEYGLASIAFTQGGQTVATATINGVIQLWPRVDPLLQADNVQPAEITYDHHGDRLGIGYISAFPEIWDDTSAPPALLGTAGTGDEAAIDASDGGVMTPDGRILAASTVTGRTLLWDLHDARHPKRIGPDLSGPRLATLHFLAISPNSSILALSTDNGIVQMWDISDPRHPRALPTPPRTSQITYGIAFSPDSRYLVVTQAGRGAEILDARGGRVVSRIDPGGASAVYDAAYAPGGKVLALEGGDHVVRLYDTSDLRHPRLIGTPLTGPTDFLFSMAISPDGTLLAAGGQDKSVWLWNIADPAEPVALGHLTPDAGQISTLVFSPNSRDLTAGTNSGRVLTWTMSPSTVATEVCSLAGSAITRGEWTRYVPGRPYDPPC